MLSILSSVSASATSNTASGLFAAAALSVLALPFFKKARMKLLYKLLAIKMKKKRKGRSNSAGNLILKALLLSILAGLLIGLIFNWTIGLWVGIGTFGVFLLFFMDALSKRY